MAVAVAADCWLQLLAVAVAHIAKKTDLAGNKKTPASIYRGVDPIVDPD